ncbi:MAG: hypothetical protein R3E53_08545 [Myxococcota bacterium]
MKGFGSRIVHISIGLPEENERFIKALGGVLSAAFGREQSAMSTPGFHCKLAIVGLGLLGGSVAAAARSRGLVRRSSARRGGQGHSLGARGRAGRRSRDASRGGGRSRSRGCSAPSGSMGRVVADIASARSRRGRS